MRGHFHDALLLLFTMMTAATQSMMGGELLVDQKAANATEAIPSPLVILPSQYWDGVEGLWSSFALRVGTPAQIVRVLASTNSPETMVVLPLGCTSAAIDPVPSDCANSRGGLFSLNMSTTWQDQGLFGINQDGVGFEADLGYSQNADYGLETLGLGFVAGANGPTLEKQTVAAIATASPFYLGILGMSTQPVNYSTVGNFSASSYFSTLRSHLLIPSLSWSFTAGAKYRLKAGQYAQLIFGGYDSSRFIPNSASFTLNQDVDRDIVVAIQSITFSGTTQSSLLSTPTFAFIESTDPNFWLPEAACQAFEQAFGLSTDNATSLYLLNSTHYAQLQTANPQVTFTLSNSLSGGQTVNIVLPFSAFALPATPPFTPNKTLYFPLRKAANDSQITLGRAFLQEALVDYERGNFSVSQCEWQDGVAPQIATIISPTYNNSLSSTTPTTTATLSSRPSTVPVGVIVGAVVGGASVLVSAVGLGYFIIRSRKSQPLEEPIENIGLTNPSIENKKDQTDNKSTFSHQEPNSPYLSHKMPDTRGSMYKSEVAHNPDAELGTQGEIFQMPTTEHDEDGYFATAHRIASERRAITILQIDGRSLVYEVPGSEPARIEMDATPVMSVESSTGLQISRPISRESSLGSPSDADKVS
ncbi:hypothetical protein B7463_g7553, partial [Scytalidium lignicola]